MSFGAARSRVTGAVEPEGARVGGDGGAPARADGGGHTAPPPTRPAWRYAIGMYSSVRGSSFGAVIGLLT